MSPVGNEPSSRVGEAADSAIKAIENYFHDAGLEIDHLLIILKAVSVPEDELDSVVAGQGIGDPRQVVALLGTHFMGAAEQVGLQVQMIPMQRPPGQG